MSENEITETGEMFDEKKNKEEGMKEGEVGSSERSNSETVSVEVYEVASSTLRVEDSHDPQRRQGHFSSGDYEEMLSESDTSPDGEEQQVTTKQQLQDSTL